MPRFRSLDVSSFRTGQRTRGPRGEIFPFRVLGERKIEAGKGGSGPRDATSSRREKPLSTALRGVAPEGGDLAGAGADYLRPGFILRPCGSARLTARQTYRDP